MLFQDTYRCAVAVVAGGRGGGRGAANLFKYQAECSVYLRVGTSQLTPCLGLGGERACSGVTVHVFRPDFLWTSPPSAYLLVSL